MEEVEKKDKTSKNDQNQLALVKVDSPGDEGATTSSAAGLQLVRNSG